MFLPHRGIPVTPMVEYCNFFSSSKPVPASILRPSTHSIHSNRWGEWLVTSVSITSGSYSRIRIFFSTQIVIVALDSNCNRRRWIQSRIVSYQWLAYPSYFFPSEFFQSIFRSRGCAVVVRTTTVWRSTSHSLDRLSSLAEYSDLTHT